MSFVVCLSYELQSCDVMHKL